MRLARARDAETPSHRDAQSHARTPGATTADDDDDGRDTRAYTAPMPDPVRAALRFTHAHSTSMTTPRSMDDDDDVSTICSHDDCDECESARRQRHTIDVGEDADASGGGGGGGGEDDLERWSALTVRHILAARGCPVTKTRCTTRMREIQTAADACATMIERECDEMAPARTDEGREKIERVMDARMVLVENLVRTQLTNDFSCVTTALAVMYLDYFIAMSGYVIASNSCWLYQLVSCACMLIAVKFEESEETARRDISARLQSTSDISFDHVAVAKMEGIVLRELNWAVSRVTPFQYVPYFLCLVDGQSFIRGDKDRTTKILRRAEILSLMVLYNVNILARCESSVIAKAILCIVLAEQCGHVYEESCIARTIVTHILHHLYEHDAEHFEMVNARVLECMRMMTDFTNTVNAVVHRTRDCNGSAHLTGDQPQMRAIAAE